MRMTKVLAVLVAFVVLSGVGALYLGPMGALLPGAGLLALYLYERRRLRERYDQYYDG